MAYFVDSSVLVKLYHQEGDSSRYRQLLSPAFAQSEVLIAEIAPVELVSAFTKLTRMGKLTLSDLESVLGVIEASLHLFSVVPQSESILVRSKKLLVSYTKSGLRALDALQLASAVEHKASISVLVSADRVLSECARYEGFVTEPPH
jgi:uncharacterized protein